MESWPQNPEFRNNPEDFHPCVPITILDDHFSTSFFLESLLKCQLLQAIGLILFILVIPKCVHWQTVKAQMKCRCLRRQKLSSEKEIQVFWEIITCDPSIYI